MDMDDPFGRTDIRLDHLVLAADSLDEGARWLEARLGVAPMAGGQHLGWGTHNRLMQLGGQTYLELIAPDPGQPAPSGPRPFDMDSEESRAARAARPRLVHFVLRTSDIEQASRALGALAAPVIRMTRGNLQWRLALARGFVHGVGVQPTLIQWDTPDIPAKTLPDCGVTLEALTVTGSERELAPLRGLADARVVLHEGSVPGLAARLQGPAGQLLLD